ncbi:ThuA domain-containing protein [Dactylosporangium aurantiacum]|uniref:ThuA domain-containing protein n=1 Tax=Dactylosporangium aurantiacum TaxID=35754 RepID=A0A9Q9INM1_9ACTN|nr:ThuA domain-containing protein [Dactylosporangium aurantiacum]MDG6105613.1 ThuA domain-containing protein [Dactylosporangium aurantiacum]UWZ57052.1 ThuA domain-containing protein [Dactylosporangium aurantiacum]
MPSRRLLLGLVVALPVASTSVASLILAAPAWAAPTSVPATLTPSPATGTNNWYRGPVTLNLSATDATSGVQRLEYRLGNAAPFQTAVSATAPYPPTLTGSVQLTQQGSTTVGYRAVGGDGAAESVRTITVRIDTVAPVVSWPGIVDGHVGHTATLIPTRTDPAPGSGGVFIHRMWIDQTETTPQPVATATLATGPHTISVMASDAAGNAALFDQTFVVTTSYTDLDTLIGGYVTSGAISADLGTGLRATLAEAAGLAEQGRTNQARQTLNQFVAAVQGGSHTDEVRDTLVGDAHYLQDQLAGKLPADPPTGMTVTPAVGPDPIAPAVPIAASTNFPGATFRVLYFSVTKGFRHDHIADTALLVQQWGRQYGFDVDIWDPRLAPASLSSTPFTSAADLAKYKTIIFGSPVDGTNPNSAPAADALNATELAAFQDYVRAGGGFVGLHGASDAIHNVSWYRDLVGAWFTNHPGGQNGEGTCGSCINVRVTTEDSTNPATAHLPKTWLTIDELYNFDHNPRAEVHTLLSLDESSYRRSLNSGNAANNPMPLMGGDHPIAWCQRYDGGRQFSLILGHDRAQYYRESFTKILLAGINWTAGQTEANCSTFRQTRTLITTAGLDPEAATLLDEAQAAYLRQDYTAATTSLNRIIALSGSSTTGTDAARGELDRQARDLRDWMLSLK